MRLVKIWGREGEVAYWDRAVLESGWGHGQLDYYSTFISYHRIQGEDGRWSRSSVSSGIGSKAGTKIEGSISELKIALCLVGRTGQR